MAKYDSFGECHSEQAKMDKNVFGRLFVTRGYWCKRGGLTPTCTGRKAPQNCRSCHYCWAYTRVSGEFRTR